MPAHSEAKAQSADAVLVALTTGGLGDAVLFSPVLRAGQRLDVPTYLLTASPLTAAVYRTAPGLAGLSIVDANHPFRPGPWLALLRFAARIRRCGRGRTIVLACASRMNPRLCRGIARACRAGKLLMEPTPSPEKTDLEVNAEIARSLHPDASVDDAFVPANPAAEKKVSEILRAEQAGKYAVYYPSVPRPNRPRWALQRMARVAAAIQREFELTPVIVGGPSEADDWRRALRQIPPDERPHGLVLAGRLTPAESAACIRSAALAVCNDGGLMHVAGATGRPLVAIMPNTPLFYTPPGRRTRVLRPNGLACFPCYPHRPENCQDPARCIDRINAETVLAAAREVLAQ